MHSYKDAGESLKRKQDKEREAAGLPPIHRVGARGGSAAQKNNQRGGSVQGRGRGAVPVPSRGGSTFSRTMHTGLDKNLYVHLLGHLKTHGLLPVVIFTFSKKRCEENAATLVNADLCTAVEKSKVHVTIEKALERLQGEPPTIIQYSDLTCVGSDKKLPQIARMRDLLSRGVGVHHGGLLPLVKEVRFSIVEGHFPYCAHR